LAAAASPSEISHRLADPEARQAIVLSIYTSLASTFLIVLFGTPLAYAVARGRFLGKGILDAFLDLPVVLPPAVAGVALLLAFGRNGLIGGWLYRHGWGVTFTPYAVVLSQTFVAAPFYLRAAIGAFRDMDQEVEQSATMDAPLLHILRRITLPAVASSLVGGACMSWARAVGEFGATLLFAGNFPGKTQTIPLAIYIGFEMDFDRAVALAALLLGFSFTILILARLIVRKR
jgi:molybdate transport system permease protein